MRPVLLALAALLAAFALSACAPGSLTLIEEAARQRQFTETHTLTQAEAYTRLRRWAAQTYSSAGEVIQMDDAASGTLVVKGAELVSRNGIDSFPLGYTLTMDVRDNRLRFTERVGDPLRAVIAGTTVSDARQLRRRLDAIRASAIAALSSSAASDF